MQITLDDLLAANGLINPAVAEPAADSMEKVAQASGVTSEVALDLEAHLNLTKQATSREVNMTTPIEAGKNIAQLILAGLQKQAEEGEMAAAPMGNRVITETANMAATSTAGQQLQPNGGNPNQVLQMTVAQAIAAGAVLPEQLDMNVAQAGADGGNQHIPLVDTNGNYNLNAIPAQPDIQKVAAVAALIDGGNTFEQAVALVKQAEEGILADQDELVKRAAVNELMEQGFDVITAVELVKQASFGSSIIQAGKGIGGAINSAAHMIPGYSKTSNFVGTGINQVINPRQSIRGFKTTRDVVNMADQHALAKAQGSQLDSQVAGMTEAEALAAHPNPEVRNAYFHALKQYAPGLVVGGTALTGVGLAGNALLSKEAFVHQALSEGYSLDQALAALAE